MLRIWSDKVIKWSSDQGFIWNVPLRSSEENTMYEKKFRRARRTLEIKGVSAYASHTLVKIKIKPFQRLLLLYFLVTSSWKNPSREITSLWMNKVLFLCLPSLPFLSSSFLPALLDTIKIQHLLPSFFPYLSFFQSNLIIITFTLLFTKSFSS